MGRHKLIETPEKLYKIFTEYKKEVKGNPRKKIDYTGRDAKKVNIPLERPLTIEGFQNYCYEHYSDVHNYLQNTEGRYDDYKEVCTRVKKEIRQDQIEGGMVGQYNPSITQRLNGLTDKSEVRQQLDLSQVPKWLRPNNKK